MKENDIDILTLNETWLKNNFKLDIPNYTITCKDRPSRQGGGVAILVQNDIKSDITGTCSNINTDNEFGIWTVNLPLKCINRVGVVISNLSPIQFSYKSEFILCKNWGASYKDIKTLNF